MAFCIYSRSGTFDVYCAVSFPFLVAELADYCLIFSSVVWL